MNEHPLPKKAVAVRYEAGRDRAPRVVAKGERLLAERILELAREHGVTVHEDPDLVGLLAKLDIDREIPESLYVAMAEVLAFVYRLNNRMAEARRG
jgi:flagellar biosynthesis protein